MTLLRFTAHRIKWSIHTHKEIKNIIEYTSGGTIEVGRKDILLLNYEKKQIDDCYSFTWELEECVFPLLYLF